MPASDSLQLVYSNLVFTLQVGGELGLVRLAESILSVFFYKRVTLIFSVGLFKKIVMSGLNDIPPLTLVNALGRANGYRTSVIKTLQRWLK